MKTFSPLRAPDAGAAGGGGAPAGAGAVAAGGLPAGGAAAAPVPYYSDLIGKDGTLNHASFERLPENLRSLGPSLANVKTTDDLFTKIHNLNTLAGRKGLAPLPANASAEDVAAQTAILRAVNGVPEKADGYGFARPEDLPEAAWNPNHAKAAQELLHKHNASPGFAKDLLALQVSLTKENIQAQEKYVSDFYAQQDQVFREALTKDGLDYDKTTAFITRVAGQMGMDANDPILKNASTRLLLNRVGVALGEAKFVGGQTTDVGTKSDRALAEDITHNKSNPDYAAYWDANHAKNGEVKKRVEALYLAAATAERAAAAGGRK